MGLFEWLMNRRFVYLLLEFGLDNLFSIDLVLLASIIVLAFADIILQLNAITYVALFFSAFFIGVLFCTLFVLAMFIYYERYLDKGKESNYAC